MEFNEYQAQARITAIYPSDTGITYCTFGLVSEAGEVAGKIKKSIRDYDGVLSNEKVQALAHELGDVLWYLANLAHELGYDLDTIARMNYEKLFSRKGRGTLQGSGDNR